MTTGPSGSYGRARVAVVIVFILILLAGTYALAGLIGSIVAVPVAVFAVWFGMWIDRKAGVRRSIDRPR